MKQTLLLIFTLLCLLGTLSVSAQSQGNGSLAMVSKSVEKVQVYPNPASQFFSLKNDKEVAQINLLNILGKRVKTYKTLPNEKYYLHELDKGMYLIQFIDRNNAILSTQRLKKL